MNTINQTDYLLPTVQNLEPVNDFKVFWEAEKMELVTPDRLIGEMNLKLFDLNGKAVFASQEHDVERKSAMVFDLEGLDKGIYVLKVQADDSFFIDKVFVI